MLKFTINEEINPIFDFPDDDKVRVVWAYGALYKNTSRNTIPKISILLKEINDNKLTNEHLCVKISVAQLDIVRYMSLWKGRKKLNEVWGKTKFTKYKKLNLLLDSNTCISKSYRELLIDHFESTEYKINRITTPKEYWCFANSKFVKFHNKDLTIILPSFELFTSTYTPKNQKIRCSILQYNLNDVLDKYIKESFFLKNKYYIELKKYKEMTNEYFLSFAKFNSITRNRLIKIRTGLEITSTCKERYPDILPYHPSTLEVEAEGIYLKENVFLIFRINKYSLPYDNEVNQLESNIEYNKDDSCSNNIHRKHLRELNNEILITSDEKPHITNARRYVNSEVAVLESSLHNYKKKKGRDYKKDFNIRIQTIENIDDIESISSSESDSSKSSKKVGKYQVKEDNKEKVAKLRKFYLIEEALKKIKDEKEERIILDFNYIDEGASENLSFTDCRFIDVLKKDKLSRWCDIYTKEEQDDDIQKKSYTTVFLRNRRYLLIKIILMNRKFLYLFEIDNNKKSFVGLIFKTDKTVDYEFLSNLLEQCVENKGVLNEININAKKLTFKHYYKDGKLVNNLRNAISKASRLLK